MKRPFPYDPSADAERRRLVALFRYGVIVDLIHIECGQRGLYAKLREKAAQDWTIPGSQRRKVEAETIRGVALVIGDMNARVKLPEGMRLSPSTVHRVLSRAGLMQKKPTEPTSKDRRRFAFDQGR